MRWSRVNNLLQIALAIFWIALDCRSPHAWWKNVISAFWGGALILHVQWFFTKRIFR